MLVLNSLQCNIVYIALPTKPVHVVAYLPGYISPKQNRDKNSCFIGKLSKRLSFFRTTEMVLEYFSEFQFKFRYTTFLLYFFVKSAYKGQNDLYWDLIWFFFQTLFCNCFNSYHNCAYMSTNVLALTHRRANCCRRKASPETNVYEQMAVWVLK